MSQWLLHSLCASLHSIRSTDLLHTQWRLCSRRVSFKYQFTLLPPSDQLTLFLILRTFPFIQTCTVVAELHIERICGLTSWGCESRLNRCTSWVDTQALPCESLLLPAGRAEVDNSLTNCAFLFSILLIYFLRLLFGCPSVPHTCTHNAPSLPHPVFHLVLLYPLERKAYSSGYEGG